MGTTTTIFQFLPTISFPRILFTPARNLPSQAYDDFFRQTSKDFQAGIDVSDLVKSVLELADEYQSHLHRSKSSMIPYAPTTLSEAAGEKTALALDLGGSTLRIAWVHFTPGQQPRHGEARSFNIELQVRKLPGAQFVAWIVDRVEEAWLDLVSTTTSFDRMNSRLSDESAHCMDEEPTFDRMHDRVDEVADATQPQVITPVALTWSFPLT